MEPKPKIVGVGWVIKCEELLDRVDEEPYQVEVHSYEAGNRVRKYPSSNESRAEIHYSVVQWSHDSCA